MRQTRIIMDMPVIVEVVGPVTSGQLEKIFDYFRRVDETFSTFKKTSEITKINNGHLVPREYSKDMKEIFRLADQTKVQTSGYFDIRRGDVLDPSGIVKGWAIRNAARQLSRMGFTDYYVEAGGDIEVAGHNKDGYVWTIGIRNPFRVNQIVKRIGLHNRGIATSGTYERGNHIYNPKKDYAPAADIASMTVIGPDIYEADRFATAAFAMGRKGIEFIAARAGLEGYMIDTHGVATFTPGFASYEIH